MPRSGRVPGRLRVKLSFLLLLPKQKATKLVGLTARPFKLNFGSQIRDLRWRRRQDSNLWYPFGVQRFSKPPLSATQPRLRTKPKKPGFNSIGDANFVKV